MNIMITWHNHNSYNQLPVADISTVLKLTVTVVAASHDRLAQTSVLRSSETVVGGVVTVMTTSCINKIKSLILCCLLYLGRCWPVCGNFLWQCLCMSQYPSWATMSWSSTPPCSGENETIILVYNRGHYPAVLHWPSWSWEQLNCHCGTGKSGSTS